MGTYLYFRGILRLFVELFFELMLISSLSLHTVIWNTPFISERFSSALSITCTVLVIVGPLYLIVLLCKLPSKWSNQHFMDKYGVIFDDFDPKKMENKERALLVWPIVFFLRRVVFVLLVLITKDFLWMQLAVQNFVSVGLCIYL